MLVEVKLDGQTVVKADLDVSTALTTILAAAKAMSASPPAKSYPITVEQARTLLKRIDDKSGELLKLIASNDGSLPWGRMQKLFNIGSEEWSEYSTRHGKGITRALRNITGSNGKLIWWDDDDETWEEKDNSAACVYIDGQALESLKAVFGH